MSKPDYKGDYAQTLKRNFETFDIDSDDMKLKIKNFSKKFGFPENEVYEHIKEDKMLEAWFIKDPGKQNVYEKTFLSFLKTIPGVKDAVHLPAGGKDSVFVLNQKVFKKSDDEYKGNSKNNISAQAKSMDFSFKYKDIDDVTFYVFQKYTNEAGGAQDNQRNDVINAIDKASGLWPNENIFVLFVCDGDYYSKGNWDLINAHIKDRNFRLIKSEDLEKFLNNFYGDYKKQH